jgi:DNA-binding transcriptional MocR family regulator
MKSRNKIQKAHNHGRFSILPSRILYDSRLDNKWDKHVRLLSLIGVYDNKEGWCYPGLDTLADIIGVSRQTIVNWSTDLEAWGYLSIRKSKNNQNEYNPNRYKIMHDATLPQEFDVSKLHTVDLDTVSKTDIGDLDTVSKNHAQNLKERPIERPIERSAIAENLTTTEEQAKQDLSDFEAIHSMSSDLPPAKLTGAGVADPTIERKEFVRRYAPQMATILQHEYATNQDKSATRKLFDKKYPREWLDRQLAQYQNGGGEQFRKDNATAYWITNKLDEEYAGRARPTEPKRVYRRLDL